MSELPDYKKLIDDEIWAFIERTERWFPADTIDKGIDEQRAIYNAMCGDFQVARPDGVAVVDGVVESTMNAIPIRRYSVASCNQAAHIVYMHGGGFVVGGLDSHDDVCAEICTTTEINLTSVDYRLSPEHKHPAAFNDCVAAVLFEAKRADKAILLCGDSAGANLCAAVAHSLRNTHGRKVIAGQVLIYPELGADKNVGSYISHANAPMLSTADVHFYNTVRSEGEVPVEDVTFAPLNDSDFSSLPPTLAISAECDPLADDARQYCEAINAAGGKAVWRNEPGLVHGYLRARHSSKKAAQSVAAITEALREFAGTVG